MKTKKQETVKFHLSADTWNRLREAANESANAGFAPQDWDTKHECERVGKIAEEMAAAKYENGLLTVSREAFDHIMAELDWIASDYFNNRGGYSGDTEVVGLAESEKERIAWAYDNIKKGKEYAREGNYGSAVYFNESAARYLLDVLSKRFPEVEEIKKGGVQ